MSPLKSSASEHQKIVQPADWRSVVVEEAWRTGGFGAEIASQIQEQAFDHLDAPIGRVAGAEVPTPYSQPLEMLAIPSLESVVAAVESALGR